MILLGKGLCSWRTTSFKRIRPLSRIQWRRWEMSQTTHKTFTKPPGLPATNALIHFHLKTLWSTTEGIALITRVKTRIKYFSQWLKSTQIYQTPKPLINGIGFDKIIYSNWNNKNTFKYKDFGKFGHNLKGITETVPNMGQIGVCTTYCRITQTLSIRDGLDPIWSEFCTNLSSTLLKLPGSVTPDPFHI